MSKNIPISNIIKELGTLKQKNAMKDLSDVCHCIQESSAKSGRGLSTGEKIDFFITTQFLPSHLNKSFKPYHKGEADFKINSTKISFKTTKSGGELALCWSRNDDASNQTNPKPCDHWKVPILIYVRESSQWWKSGPKKPWSKKKPNKKKPFTPKEKQEFTEVIKPGLYLIDTNGGTGMPGLRQNNKSTCIIDKQEVYKLLVKAKNQKLFIKMPEPDKKRFKKMKFVFVDGKNKDYNIS
jgi:hypothetical protein